MKANPLSYPTSRLPFDLEVFRDPPKEYRGAPFWGWVTKQEKQKTVQQIDVMEQMGMGGFHMHTRVGLDIEYMGEEFMDIVKGCVERAKEKGMSALLYDEDRWPSGFAGGKVLDGHPELKGLHLLFTPWRYGVEVPYAKPTIPIANAAPVRSELGTLIACFAIRLHDGQLISSRRISEGEDAQPNEKVWYAYAEPLPDSGFFGDQTYPDLLSAATTNRFIEVTHAVYEKECGEDFGGTIPSIFTDEPQYCPLSTLDLAEGEQDIFLPWTTEMPTAFKNRYGVDLIDQLPYIIWDSPQSGLTRYRFLDNCCEMFASNYLGVLAEWCGKRGLYCTGHMNAEPTLASQTAQTGEVMRCYRDMQLPGIDMLCDNHEYNTAKQAQSVARQFGRPGLMSEMYGVTGWQFTFEGHKGQGDWQAALGVTLRVHHLFWSTMEGEAKRDYPACIGYQSPWWKEYHHIEDHFARVNSILTRGKPVTRVAVIHPIESYWLNNGPKDQNGEDLEFREQAFSDLTSWLLLSHIDFDFISESLFPSLTDLDSVDKQLSVGRCKYDVVVLPDLKTIRSTTLVRLQRFAEQGGKIIIAGSPPTLVDAQEVTSPPVFKNAVQLPWSKAKLLSALKPYRDIDMIISYTTLYRKQGYRADTLIYQMREEGDLRYIFICNVDRKEACPVDVVIQGKWQVEVLDSMNGKTWELDATHDGDNTTRFPYYFDGCESLLIRLIPGESSVVAKRQKILRLEYKQVHDVHLNSVSLSEPNTLLLDHCKYRWEDEEWNPAEEILRIDQIMRERLGFFKKGAKFRQPYTIPIESRKAAGRLRLKFTIDSDIFVKYPILAIESPTKVKIRLDGCDIPSDSQGWWVDQDIKTVTLPSFDKGKHELELEYQYGPLTNLERVYVLGDFGVDVRGRSTKIVSMDLGRIEWGDITRMGLPFYTGNITYHCDVNIEDETEDTAIRVAHYAGPVVSVDVDTKRTALLVNEPYAFELGTKLSRGQHAIDFTCYGNRHNAFGAIHLVPDKTNWLGADTWRSDYDWWSEEYVLGSIGILNAPRVEKVGREVSQQTRRGKQH